MYHDNFTIHEVGLLYIVFSHPIEAIWGEPVVELQKGQVYKTFLITPQTFHFYFDETKIPHLEYGVFRVNLPLSGVE